MADRDNIGTGGDEAGEPSDARLAEDASPAGDEEDLPEVTRRTSLQASQMRSILEGITPKLDFAPLLPKVNFSVLDYMKPILEPHASTTEIFNRSLRGMVRPPTINFGELAGLSSFSQFTRDLGLQAVEQLQRSLTAEALKLARPDLGQIFLAARAVQPLLDEIGAEAKREKPRLTASQVTLLLSVIAIIVAALAYWNDVEARAQQGRADAAELQQMQEMSRQQQETNEQLAETRRVIVDLVDLVARVRVQEPADNAPPTQEPGRASAASGDDVAPSQ